MPIYDFEKRGSHIFPVGDGGPDSRNDSAVKIKRVAEHYGTFPSVIHAHPRGYMSRETVRKVEDQLLISGKINLD